MKKLIIGEIILLKNQGEKAKWKTDEKMGTCEKFQQENWSENLNWTVVENIGGKTDEKIRGKIVSRKIDEKMDTGEKILAKKLG